MKHTKQTPIVLIRVLPQLRMCTSPWPIRVENAHTGFPTQIPNAQPILFTDNAMNCVVKHLPVYKSIQLSTHIIVYQHSSALKQIASTDSRKRSEQFLKQELRLRE